ncbi:MAG: DUF4304 domain-containing protein [Saprospiraceae bacterium]|nr:DUF4304 domain-containing protein [Saprospiraceae bacterium]MBK6666111.1 DUF4304 domain-containing protein [Saprospiraceae bacterium]MBK8827990.1 DUF4304 domain-containing protein [Saprospiraceae bacterium]MBK9581273.1 DUF4304 domain-containing protein [Saprospiraceae bacterium]HQV66436.1 DUF4304 domain-containing protein [Saprospiraceae bacterium]
MQKEDLINIIKEELTPLGFKKKGNFWILKGNEITKYLRIQKSQWSNLFYIYYGYILENLRTDDDSNSYEKGFNTRVFDEEGNRLNILDFENNLDKIYRINEIRKVIKDNVITNFTEVNTEEDVLADIKKLTSLNLVFLSIRKYFGL